MDPVAHPSIEATFYGQRTRRVILLRRVRLRAGRLRTTPGAERQAYRSKHPKEYVQERRRHGQLPMTRFLKIR